MLKKINNIKNKLITISLAFSAFIFSSSAFATAANTGGIAGRVTGLNQDVSAVAQLFMLVVGLAGALLLFLGIWGLKKYGENPQQNPLMKPIVMTLAGGLMAGFTALQIILAESFTGDGIDESTGRDGFTAPASGT